MIPELTYDQARRAMDEKAFSCDSTEEIKPLDTILGQERAVRALNLGLRIKDKGFNIFISGIQGTGRKSAIQDFSTALAVKQPVPPDWCYVNNFVDSSRPRAISLVAGQGALFKKAMERLVTQIPPALREAFESAEYAKQREAVVQKINQERNEIVANINALAKEVGFLLQPSPVGIALTPIVEGRPLNDAEFQQLPPALQKKINELSAEVEGRTRTVESLTRQLKETEGALEIRIREIAALTARAQDQDKQLFRVKEDLESREKELSACELEKEKLQAQVYAASIEKSEIERMLASVKGEYEALQSRMASELNSTAAPLQDKIAQLSGKVSEYDRRLAEAESEKGTLAERLSKAEGEVERQVTALRRLASVLGANFLIEENDSLVEGAARVVRERGSTYLMVGEPGPRRGLARLREPLPQRLMRATPPGVDVRIVAHRGGRDGNGEGGR